MKEKKPEILEIFGLDGISIGRQERNEFYAEIRKEYKQTNRITRQVRVVRFLLMTSDGRIYIQKRSHKKRDNSGLYDKTVGGHVKAGYSADMAAIMECQEELAIPGMVLADADFEAVRDDIDLSVIGIMQKIEQMNRNMSIRQSADGSSINQPLITSFYVGYYNGSLRFKDGESTGVETFSLDELESLMRKEPERFTEDLRFMINRFRDYLVPLKDYRR